MKKVLFIIGLFVSMGISAQDDTLLNVGSGVFGGASKKDIITQINSNISDISDLNLSVDSVDLGWYNVKNYGAVGDGVTDDVDEIQAAIDVASTQGSFAEAGATVYIPNGTYLISSEVKLRSNTHIKISDGAKFIFPTGYTGAMWTNDTLDTENPANNRLVNASVSGGIYGEYNDYRTHTLLDLYANDGDSCYIFNCHFKDMFANYMGTSVRITITNDGWVNGNKFEDITAWRPRYGILETGGSAGVGFEYNTFDNYQIQTDTDSTLTCVDFEQGQGNVFNQLVFWDVAAGTTRGSLGSDFDNNIFIGRGVTGSTWSDNGDNNFVYNTVKAREEVNLSSLADDTIWVSDYIREYALYDQHLIFIWTGSSALTNVELEINTDIIPSGTKVTIVGRSDSNTISMNHDGNQRNDGRADLTLGLFDVATYYYSGYNGYWLQLDYIDY